MYPFCAIMNQPTHKGEFKDGYEKENQDGRSIIDHRQVHQAQHSKETSKDIS